MFWIQFCLYCILCINIFNFNHIGDWRHICPINRLVKQGSGSCSWLVWRQATNWTSADCSASTFSKTHSNGILFESCRVSFTMMYLKLSSKCLVFLFRPQWVYTKFKFAIYRPCIVEYWRHGGWGLGCLLFRDGAYKNITDSVNILILFNHTDIWQ